MLDPRGGRFDAAGFRRVRGKTRTRRRGGEREDDEEKGKTAADRVPLTP
jgi:hypothetical protein